MAAAPGRKRVSADVPDEVYQGLLQAKIEDGAGVTTRTRALVEMWFADEKLQAAVTEWLRAERAGMRPRV